MLLDKEWMMSTVRTRGESPKGVWTLGLRDQKRGTTPVVCLHARASCYYRQTEIQKSRQADRQDLTQIFHRFLCFAEVSLRHDATTVYTARTGQGVGQQVERLDS